MKIQWVLAWVLLCVWGVSGCDSPPEKHDPSPEEASLQPQQQNTPEPVEFVSSESIVMSPVLDCELEQGRNVLWCATLPIVWQDLQPFLQERPGSPLSRALEAEKFPSDALPETGVVRVSGYVKDGVVEEIRRQMRDLPGSPQPQLLASLPPLTDAIAFAYIQRALEFRRPFDLYDGASFDKGDHRVRWFGIWRFSPRDPDARALARQVRVLSYRTMESDDDPEDDEYVVELLSQSHQDRLILARILPEKTLGQTVASVMQRISQHSPRLLPMEEADFATSGDELSRHDRAMMDLFEEEDFDHHKVGTLLPGDTVMVPEIRIAAVRKWVPEPPIFLVQRVQFNLDRKGARIEAEAVGGTWGSKPFRELVFHKPFLVLLLRRGASRPYFALWVANDEIMFPASPEEAH